MKPFHIDPIDFDSLRGEELQSVGVAVIDSGIDATHHELRSRVFSAWRAQRGADAILRAVEVCNPINQDEHRHGTAVAGIICAIAPNAVIHDYKIFADLETPVGEGMLACLEAAIESNVRIINMSLAAKSKMQDKISLLIERAYRRGIIVVGSQRNYPVGDLGLPAELSYCIGVDLHNEPSPYQIHYRYGHVIPFVARGDNVLAPASGGGYMEVTGTSFATPTVAGLCSLLLGAYPELEQFEIKAILKACARGGYPNHLNYD